MGERGGRGFNTLFVILLWVGISYGGSCPIVALPPLPPFPTSFIPLTPATSPSNPLTTGHWSETALLKNYRNFDQPVSTQTNCPHQRAGLKNWHDASTWSPSGIPANGANVDIPASTHVLISSCSIDSAWTFGTITIPYGSSLTFNDAIISIRARGFNVNGALYAGNETCRLRNKITITLTGSRPLTVPADPWVKGISVQGSIDLHGALYTPTWTRLAMTARPNDTTILIQDIVNWQPGQKIVITTSELKDSRDWHRNEERVIKSVQRTAYENVSAIELTEPLQYKHFAGREYQVEVALLSRNIIVQGSEADSEPTDTANSTCKHGDFSTYPCENSYLTGWGAHIFVNGPNSAGRFSGVEAFRVGQTNALARYPFHFHLMGNITSSNYGRAYVRDSSVHRSYFRCYAIHGTSGALLTQNTAYDAIGHCYFLEDGVEESNIISYNQAAHVHSLGKYWNPSIGSDSQGSFYSQYLDEYPDTPTLILPSDMAAGCFYITNTYNDIFGNAASGGFAGFSIPSLQFPVKMFNGDRSFSPAVRPFRSAFRGNSAHSSGYWWASAGGIYVGGELRQEGTSTTGRLWYTSGRSRTRDTCIDKAATTTSANGGCWTLSNQLWLRFEDNKVFLANRGLQNWGTRSDLIRFEFHDVALSMNVFGSVWIDQMLMNCRTSSNVLVKWQGCTAGPEEWKAWNCNTRDIYFFYNIGGFQWYDVSQKHILTNSIFRNCRDNWPQCLNGKCDNVAVFTSLTHSDQFVPEQMQMSNQIQYQNCTKKWRFSTPANSNPGITVSGRDQNWYDHDGSASGLGKKAMIGSARARDWWKYNSECELEDENWKCPMQDGDSAASVYFGYDKAQEDRIGNSMCYNGGALPFGTNDNPTPRQLCPIIGKVSHWGTTNESAGYELAGNPKVSGPIINSRGGWFVRFTDGTPATLKLSNIQVKQNEALLLAFPYPANTKFEIYNFGADWCSPSWAVCRHNYTEVNSIGEVRSAWGDAYYWDNAAKILYLRVVTANPTFASPNPTKWPTTGYTYEDTFTRGGLTLYTAAYQTFVYIKALNCGAARCAAQPGVNVPAAFSLGAAPTTASASITGSSISQPTASIGTAASGSAIAAATLTVGSATTAGSSASAGSGSSTGAGLGSSTGSGSGSGSDSSTDSGSDSGSDSTDSGSDSGSDSTDSGSDSGSDSSDSGSDSGSDSSTGVVPGSTTHFDPDAIKGSAIALSSPLLFALLLLLAIVA